MGKIKRPGLNRGSRVSAPESTGVATTFDHPVFCLRYLQRNHDICDCSPEQRQQLLDQMRLLSQKSWLELHQAPYRGIGSEKIPRHQIQKAIPESPVVTDDVTFIAFRFAGKAPMIGYRHLTVFRILWLDHDFSVYNHGS